MSDVVIWKKSFVIRRWFLFDLAKSYLYFIFSNSSALYFINKLYVN